ncbi:MAG: hypothetical protein CMN02_12480 [Roseibacillus sp.]|nr:hypothetical protein [Roseibacillus sp.]
MQEGQGEPFLFMLNLVFKPTSKILGSGAVRSNETRWDPYVVERGKGQRRRDKQFSVAGHYASLRSKLELVSSSLIRVCHGLPIRRRPESFLRNPAGKNDFLPGDHSRTCPGGSGHLFD